MKDTYVFIIWNKALWCKDRIINDLKKSFTIVQEKYIQWSPDNFEADMRALYGRKLGNPYEKIQPCGKGDFLFLLVRDQDPEYQERKMYDGSETVNAHIYDKKMLYRKWTGGCHRVHCSDTEKETLHDLAVLFGPDYENIFDGKEEKLCLDTKPVTGFASVEDLKKSLNLFGDNSLIVKGKDIFIFADCRYDVVSFTGARKCEEYKYHLSIGNDDYDLYVFGERDGDLPSGFLKHPELAELIVNNISLYLGYLQKRQEIDAVFKNGFEKSGLSTDFKPKEVERENLKPNVIKNEIRLLMAKISFK